MHMQDIYIYIDMIWTRSQPDQSSQPKTNTHLWHFKYSYSYHSCPVDVRVNQNKNRLLIVYIVDNALNVTPHLQYLITITVTITITEP